MPSPRASSRTPAKAPRKPQVRFEQIIEGEWFRPTLKHLEKCCGCGIVHGIEYKIREGELWVRVKVLRRPRSPRPR